MTTLYWVRISMMLAVGFIAVVFSLMPEGAVQWERIVTDSLPTILVVVAVITCVAISLLLILKRSRSNVDDEINEMYNQYEQRSGAGSVSNDIDGATAAPPRTASTNGFGKRT